MHPLLKIFLPYSMLFGIAVAVYVSTFKPNVEAEGPAGGVMVHSSHSEGTACADCGSRINVMEFVTVHAVDGQRATYTCTACAESSDRLAAPVVPSAAASLAMQTERHVDPVCRMEVNPAWGFEASYEGKAYHFCTSACRERFAQAPGDFLGDRCVVCHVLIEPGAVKKATYLGRTYGLCSDEHRRRFKAEPATFFMHTMWGIPSWMYYGSIGVLLVISFGLFDVVGNQRTADRAVGFAGAAAPALLGPSAAPVPTTGDRLDLLQIRLFQRLIKSRLFRFVCQAAMVVLFFLVIAAGLFGNQNPALNIAPLLTWTLWWGGLIILIMYAGKAWCYVCPWDAVAGWMEKLRLWKKVDEGLSLNLKWPRAVRNVLIATVLFVGLTWVELGFGVTMKPRVTAYLALAMLLMAVVSAFLFQRKSFCRYGCLVGRVSGLYAMFSGVEIRARDDAVCKSCHGKECVRGSEAAYGCPTFLYPAMLKTNTYCIQCAECIQACPEDNLTLNMRPWGSDLGIEHKPRSDEAYLALLMLSITGFHGLTMTANWRALTDWLSAALSLGKVLAFSLGMTVLLFAPIVVYAILVGLSHRLGTATTPPLARKLSYHDYFIRYAYALLPIALFYHLAHNIEHLLMEGPKVISLISDPFGWGWNLFGTLDWSVPPLVSLDVLWIIQVALVLVGHLFSLWATRRTSINIFSDRRAAWRSQLPMLAGMICFSVFSLWLLKQPMEMRTSAM